MGIKTGLCVCAATAGLCGAFAQEAFDAEKTKAMFAGTEWFAGYWGWHSEVTFMADGTVDVKADGYKDKNRTAKWTPTGPRSVSADNAEWVMSQDGKELYVSGFSGLARKLCVFYRGKKFPPEYPFFKETLTKQGIVWVKQGSAQRDILAFNREMEAVWSVGGVEKRSGKIETNPFGAGQFCCFADENTQRITYLIQEGNGERVLRNWEGDTYRPEPAQPGDPLPPQIISRARSPFSGAAWCRPDGKGKLVTLTFMANGTVSVSNFPNEKPEWNPYDNGSVRYKLKGNTHKLALSEDKKRLVRETDKAREIWFSGRQLPRLTMNEGRQMKEKLATDNSKAWVNWDDGKKTVYAFDAKNSSVTITVDGIKQPAASWEPLCAGCIRVGEEVFMFEGDTLERLEPRMTLKQEPNL